VQGSLGAASWDAPALGRRTWKEEHAAQPASLRSRGRDGAARNTEWVRGAWAKLEPFTEGYYVKLGETQQEAHEHRVHSAYGDNYPRLAALKRRSDPKNLFRLNANIKPAA